LYLNILSLNLPKHASKLPWSRNKRFLAEGILPLHGFTKKTSLHELPPINFKGAYTISKKRAIISVRIILVKQHPLSVSRSRGADNTK